MNRAVPNFRKISIEHNCGNCGHEIIGTLEWAQFNKLKYKKHPEDPCDSYTGSMICSKCKSVIEVIIRIMINSYESQEERDEAKSKLKPGDTEKIEKTTKLVTGDQSLI